jgi:hypothetical protein
MAGHRHPIAPSVPLPVWEELLAAARVFRAAKPWEWMDDMDIFALTDEDGRPWFPSVLGAAGQVFGLALYRGEPGLRFLFETVRLCDEEPLPPDSMFEQDALVLDWGAKKALAPEDLAVLAASGHAPRPKEKQAWPCFRSHSPGWFPWFLAEEEARTLARCTRALLACAELPRQDPDFFAPCDENDRLLPTVAIARTQAGPPPRASVEWRIWELAPPAVPPVPPACTPNIPARGWNSTSFICRVRWPTAAGLISRAWLWWPMPTADSSTPWKWPAPNGPGPISSPPPGTRRWPAPGQGPPISPSVGPNG